jgi:hypothetical protein
MYLEPGDAPAFAGHPLGLALSVVCAAALVLMFVGFSPLSNLTQRYGHLAEVVPNSKAVVPGTPGVATGTDTRASVGVAASAGMSSAPASDAPDPDPG